MYAMEIYMFTWMQENGNEIYVKYSCDFYIKFSCGFCITMGIFIQFMEVLSKTEFSWCCVRGKNAFRLANLQNVFELQNKRTKRSIYGCHDKQSVDKDILVFLFCHQVLLLQRSTMLSLLKFFTKF